MPDIILRSETLNKDFTRKSLGGAIPSRSELGPKKKKRKSTRRRPPRAATGLAPGSGSGPRPARTSSEGGNEAYVGEDDTHAYGADDTHAYGAGDDSDLDVNLVGGDAGVTEADGTVSREALKQKEKSEEWRADREAHAHGASMFASFATSTVASAGTAAVTESLRVRQEIAIASHFVPQALALLDMDDEERAAKWSSFSESIVDGSYKGIGTYYEVLEYHNVCYIEMDGNLVAEVPKRVKLLKLNNEEIELNAASYGAFFRRSPTHCGEKGRRIDMNI
jgi:hypothetical protein